MSSPDDTGLGLFDDTASAAGSFPMALRGYERSSVDEYVRNLESALVNTRRHAAELQNRVGTLSDDLAQAGRVDPSDIDYANLGGRASDILRLAQEQARDLSENANLEAERVKELARREADAIREQAVREGEALKTGGVAEIEHLRGRLHTDAHQQVEQAKAEAAALVDAARRQAEALQRESEHEAQAVRQTAYLDTETLRRSVEREAADARQEIAVAREQALEELRQAHEQAHEQTAALLREATEHHTEAAARLEADIADAARIRSEALAEAEGTRLAAAQDAEARVAAAEQEAIAVRQRTQQEFSWRKQQLRRETELLSQRKQAVLAQLASLSALAEQTAHSFPELEEFDDDEDGGSAQEPSAAPRDAQPAAGPGEVDATVAHSVSRTEAGGSDAPQVDSAAEPVDEVSAHAGFDAEAGRDHERAGVDRADEDADRQAIENDHTTRIVLEEPELDGDATILISTSDLPAGTEHLARPDQR